MKKSIFTLPLLLAACGGASVGPLTQEFDELVATITPPAGPAGYSALFDETITVTRKGFVYLDREDIPTVPTSEVATYNGTVNLYSTVDPASYLGDLTLAVNFGTEIIDGTGSEFYFDDNDNPNVASVGIPVAGIMVFEELDGIASATTPLDPTFDILGVGIVDGNSVEGVAQSVLVGTGADVLIGEGPATVSGDTDWFMVIVAD